MPIIREYPDPSKSARKPTKALTEAELLEEFERSLANKTPFRYSAQTANLKDWVTCPINGGRFPAKHSTKVMIQGYERTVSKFYESPEQSFIDYRGNRHLFSLDQPIEVYSIDGKVRIAASYEINNSNEIRAVTARVARHTNFYVDFEHGFRDHSAGHNKAFEKPKGEAVGIEIEVAFKSDKSPCWLNKLAFSAWMLRNYPNWICERDGSLEGAHNKTLSGLEIISPPLPIAKLKADLSIILEKCTEFGGVGYKAMTDEIPYGIHITQNLYGEFSLNDGDRYTYFFNSPAMRAFFANASRRSGHKDFGKYSGFTTVKAVKNAMYSQRENHYRAVYPRGNEFSALETRIFRSNLNHSAVCAIIDLCIWTMNYCKDPKNNLDNPQDYVKFLKERAPKTLIKYINSWRGFASFVNEESKYID